MAGQNKELTEEEKAAQAAEEQKLQEEEEQKLQEAEKQKSAKKTQAGKVTVTFLKPWSRYTRGDVAGFSAGEAERLVKGKVAVKGSKLPAQKAGQDTEPKA